MLLHYLGKLKHIRDITDRKLEKVYNEIIVVFDIKVSDITGH